jgi:hypothetical protein
MRPEEGKCRQGELKSTRMPRNRRGDRLPDGLRPAVPPLQPHVRAGPAGYEVENLEHHVIVVLPPPLA